MDDLAEGGAVGAGAPNLPSGFFAAIGRGGPGADPVVGGRGGVCFEAAEKDQGQEEGANPEFLGHDQPCLELV